MRFKRCNIDSKRLLNVFDGGTFENFYSAFKGFK